MELKYLKKVIVDVINNNLETAGNISITNSLVSDIAESLHLNEKDMIILDNIAERLDIINNSGVDDHVRHNMEINILMSEVYQLNAFKDSVKFYINNVKK